MNYAGGSSIVSMTGVAEFKVEHSYKKFVIKEAAGQDFADINNIVGDCMTEMGNVITQLSSLKEELGTNDKLIPQIDEIIKQMGKKKKEFGEKNQEMFKAITSVATYINGQGNVKAQKLGSVLSRVSSIEVKTAK